MVSEILLRLSTEKMGEHILKASVFELVEHRELVLGRFYLTDPHPKTLLITVQIDTDNNIDSDRSHMAFGSHLEEHRIHVDNCIDRLDRPALPFPGSL